MALTLGIRYLTGYAVATDQSSRKRAEWPPHPARVFMAMAAAHFETGEVAEEAVALRWLEQLPGKPTLYAGEGDNRSVVTTYVPVNDKPTGSGMLQSAVGLSRSKQPRTFPRVRPHEETVYLVWPDAEPNGYHPALEQLCGKVTRIGHSSSLVHMWVEDGEPDETLPAWEAHDTEADIQLRIFGPGALEYLERQYGGPERAAIYKHIEALQKRRSDQTKKEQKAIDKEIKALQSELRDPLRPTMSVWQGYRRARQKLDETIPGTVWDTNVIVRRLVPLESRHRRLNLASTLQVTAALHKGVLKKTDDPLPEYISGHKPDGTPSDCPHVAYLPLAFVGGEHATGHLMGIAFAIPAGLDRTQRRHALAAIGQVEELTVGRLGKWKIRPGDEGMVNLRPEVWTGGNDGARQWATVTPIAFDKHAKAKDHAERDQELGAMIKTGCERIGLPPPIQVVIMPVSAHLAVPAAHEFPRLKRKDGSDRRHAHAILIFDTPVRGPITIGAGRYRGYGLCRPLSDRKEI